MNKKPTFGYRRQRDFWITPTIVVLLAANSMLLFGIIWWDWKVFSLLLLFWCENVLIGIFYLLRLLFIRYHCASTWVCKVFALPFFCFHYGVFLLVHGIFVISWFGPRSVSDGVWADASIIFRLVTQQHLEWPLLALALSHAYSFFYHFVGRGEYRRVDLAKAMVQPYRRVIFLHLVLLVGGFAVSLLDSPVWSLVLLLLGKCWLDGKSHLQEHVHKQFETEGRTLAAEHSIRPGDP